MDLEQLWNGIVLHRGGFPLGTDSVSCAWFAEFPKRSKVADLGCGSGAIALMLLASDPTLQVTGVELQPEAAAAARKNAAANPVNFTVLEADLRQIGSLLPAGSMDGVISNPPYFPVGSGKSAAGPMAWARSEETCTLSQLCQAAAWLLRWDGRFVLVHRPERLAEAIACASAVQLEAKRLCLVRHKENGPITLILLSFRKGGKPGLQIEEICLFDSDNQPTQAYRELYHL